MSAAGVAAKNAPVVAPIVAGAFAINSNLLATIGAVVLGLVAGAMWRAGSLLKEGKGWREIGYDGLVSLLIGTANAILTLTLADWFKLDLLFTMALGVVIGATGLRALPEIREMLISTARRRLLSDGVVLVQPQDTDMDEKVKRLGQSDSGNP